MSENSNGVRIATLDPDEAQRADFDCARFLRAHGFRNDRPIECTIGVDGRTVYRQQDEEPANDNPAPPAAAVDPADARMVEIAMHVARALVDGVILPFLGKIDGAVEARLTALEATAAAAKAPVEWKASATELRPLEAAIGCAEPAWSQDELRRREAVELAVRQATNAEPASALVYRAQIIETYLRDGTTPADKAAA